MVSSFWRARSPSDICPSHFPLPLSPSLIRHPPLADVNVPRPVRWACACCHICRYSAPAGHRWRRRARRYNFSVSPLICLTPPIDLPDSPSASLLPPWPHDALQCLPFHIGPSSAGAPLASPRFLLPISPASVLLCYSPYTHTGLDSPSVTVLPPLQRLLLLVAPPPLSLATLYPPPC